MKHLPFMVVAGACAGLSLHGAGSVTMVKPEDVGLSAERLMRVHEAVQRHIDAGSLSGAVTLVARHGKIAHLEAHGLMDIESKKAMTKDAVFRLASMSKPITAVDARVLRPLQNAGWLVPFALEALMKAGVGIPLLGLLLVLASSGVGAHHSFAAQYDANKPVTLVGIVTKVEWTNPHARFYVDVKDEKGVVTNWNLELASPNVLRRNGWTRTSLNVGDEVTVEGSLAKNGSKMANARVVKLADGRKVFAGSSGGDAPPPSAEAKQ